MYSCVHANVGRGIIDMRSPSKSPRLQLRHFFAFLVWRQRRCVFWFRKQFSGSTGGCLNPVSAHVQAERERERDRERERERERETDRERERDVRQGTGTHF